MKSSWIIWWVLDLMTRAFLKIRDKGEDTGEKVIWRWRHNLECCVYKARNAKGCWQPLEAGEKTCNRSSLSLQKNSMLPTHWFHPLASKPVGNAFLLGLSHQGCNLFQQPCEMNIPALFFHILVSSLYSSFLRVTLTLKMWLDRQIHGE